MSEGGATEGDGKRTCGVGASSNDNLGMGVCDRICTYMNSAQSACELKSLQ